MPLTEPLVLKVAQASDIDELLDYENRKLSETVTNPDDRAFEAWKAKWRREALEHYLNLGWSFVARDHNQVSSYSKDGLLMGYFIAQPLLFFEGHTQSLWVEHLQYTSLQARDELCELAYKLSREKHLQKVFFPNSQLIANSVKQLKGENWSPQVLQIVTTKLSQ